MKYVNMSFKNKKSKVSYEGISIHDLILLGIHYITEEGETCTFERLVAECFKRFPEVFRFKRYPQWPKSLKF